MIQKLRLKFTIIAMVSMTLVLGIIIVGINILNYNDVVKRADEILTVLSSNEGGFPDYMNHLNRREDIPDNGFRKPKMRFNDSPEVAFESRFFSVLFSDNGEILNCDTGRIAAVNEETAIEYAQNVFARNKSQGFIENYRFSKVTGEDGNIRVIFYDCGRNLDNFRNFRNLSIEVSAIGLVVVFAMIVYFSGIVFKPVVESYEKQKRFITDAGHEIRTPLTIIGADADVLEMELSDNNEWLSDIKIQTSRLNELTDELIMLSKMEEGKDNLDMSIVDVSELAEEATMLFSNSITAEKKSLVKRIDENVRIKCDERAMKKVFSILLNNAIKYSSADSEIKLEVGKTGNGARIIVENNIEKPLSDKDMEHLFDRFYRPDESRNSELGGNGIGLSIAKAVVDAHKGSIRLKNDNNHFVVEIKLPIA